MRQGPKLINKISSMTPGIKLIYAPGGLFSIFGEDILKLIYSQLSTTPCLYLPEYYPLSLPT